MYGNKYRLAERDPHTGRLYVLIIQEKDYVGALTDMDGTFTYGLEQPNPRNWWDNQLLKSSISLDLVLMGDAASDFATDIVEAPLDKYLVKITRIINGTQVRITTSLRGDTIRYPIDPLQPQVRIEASDFELEESQQVDIVDSGQKPIIELIAEFLAFDQDIEVISGITSSAINSADDFLAAVTVDRSHLKDYVNNGEDKKISKKEAIERLLPHGFFLFQEDGVYKIYEIPYILEKGGFGMRRFRYDSSGVLLSSTTGVSIRRSYNDNNDFQRPNSENQWYGGFSTLGYTYKHKGTFGNFALSQLYIVQSPTTTKQAEGLFPTIDGIKLAVTGTVRIITDVVAFQTGTADITIRTSDSALYYNGNDWQAAATTIPVSCNSITGGQDPSDTLRGSVNFNTTPVPNGQTAQGLVIEFGFGQVQQGNIQQIEYAQFVINTVASNAFENSEEVEYIIENDNNYQVQLDLKDKTFGVGPSLFSKSALRPSGSPNAIINNIQNSAGTISVGSLGAYVLLQINGVQGVGNQIWRPTLISKYRMGEVIAYNLSNFLLLGGRYSPRTGELSDVFAVRSRWSPRGGIIAEPVYPPPREVSPLRDPGGIVADATITPTGKIRKQVEVETGGADGTLSKRTKSLGDAGMFQEMQANETVTIAATSRIDDVSIGDAVLLSVEVDSGVVGKVSISGISNVITNRILYIFAKDRDLPLLHENTNSVASNRFDLPGGANVEIPAGAFACCMYINFRWRVQQIT